MTKTVFFLSFISILSFAFKTSYCQVENPEINVVYGEKHIFTISTPKDWVNDKKSAKSIGLVCFFYAEKDASLKRKSYMYAHGYDKASSEENLEKFIKADLETYGKKYPDFKFENINLGFTGGIISAKMYTFFNLTDRFKEEVIYMETESSILIFVFSAQTENDYENYQPIFDQFVNSFNYRGDNPQPYLNYVNSKQN